MFETATLRSGYLLPDTAGFAERVERMLRLSLDVPLEEAVSVYMFYLEGRNSEDNSVVWQSNLKKKECNKEAF